MADNVAITKDEADNLILHLGATVNNGDVIQIGQLEVPPDIETTDINLVLTDDNGVELPTDSDICEPEDMYYWLPSNVYIVLKWVAIVLLPVLSWFYQSVGDVWGAPFVPQVSYTLAALGTLIAALIGASALKNKITKDDLGE